MTPSTQDVGVRYGSVRQRLDAVLRELPSGGSEPGWDTSVDACPGWRVRDVLAHLVGNLEDGAAGRLNGPPSPELTADQVERHREDEVRVLLERWNALASFAEPFFSTSGTWPVFLDAVSHEHDVRAAIGRPGARADTDVIVAARVLAGWGSDEATVEPATPFDLVLDDDPPRRVVGGSGEPLVLATDSFTWLRLRMGRRSADEVRALSWSDDPAGVLDRLFVFGPRTTPSAE